MESWKTIVIWMHRVTPTACACSCEQSHTALGSYQSKKNFEEEFLIGTPEKIIEKINLFIDKGVSHFMLWFMDYPDQKGIKLFNDKIISNYS